MSLCSLIIVMTPAIVCRDPERGARMSSIHMSVSPARSIGTELLARVSG